MTTDTGTDNQNLSDQGDPRKYFAMIEHMADDDLNPYEYRLLGHYKRVCGEKNGKCTESVRTTAEKCQMSTGQVSETRATLAGKDWLVLKIHKEKTEKGNWLITGSTVTLKDRWAENVARYAKSTPSSDEEGCSRSEQVQGETCSCGEQGCSCGETKKNLKQEEQKEKSTASAVPDDFKAIQEHAVEMAFAGNTAKFGAAGDVANWALCRNEKGTWSAMHPAYAFTLDEWRAFCLWYADKVSCARNGLSWPRDPNVWNDQAHQFRREPMVHYSYMAKINPPPPAVPVSDEVLDQSLREMGIIK